MSMPLYGNNHHQINKIDPIFRKEPNYPKSKQYWMGLWFTIFKKKIRSNELLYFIITCQNMDQKNKIIPTKSMTEKK